MSHHYYGAQDPPLTWQSTAGGYVHHPHAVAGGFDVNGETIFVGRVLHTESGELIPGKIVPSHNACYIPWGGREISNSTFQTLTHKPGVETVWIATQNNNIPTGSIQGGVTNTGEPLFIGRHEHQGSWVVGKVHPSHKTLYVPFGGEEVAFHKYEILCLKHVPL